MTKEKLYKFRFKYLTIDAYRTKCYPSFIINAYKDSGQRASYELTLGLIWFHVFIHYPYDFEDSPNDTIIRKHYGWYLYSVSGFPNSFWYYHKNKLKSIYLPWYYDWVRTSTLKMDGTWIHETKGKHQDLWDETKRNGIIYKETLPSLYMT